MNLQNTAHSGGALSKKQAVEVPGYAWVILVVVFLASVAAPLNQFKVPPIMSVLMETFQIGLTMAGMLMSVFAVTGFILAIPAGVIMQKLGPKTTGLIAIGFLAAGAVMGALSTSIGLMMASRVIEGVGMGLIAVVAPALIAIWFPAESRGTPMGIWATWMPMGSIIMYSLAPTLSSAMGWQVVWWFGAGFTLIIFILYWALIKMPPVPSTGSKEAGSPAKEQPRLREGMANRNLWLLAVSFCCFCIVAVTLNIFLPTFLAAERGYSLASASFMVSVGMIVTLVVSPLSGWISDRIGSRKLVLIVPSLALVVMPLFPFSISGWMIPVYMILQGVIIGAIPTAAFASVPELMGNPQLVGIGMAVMAFSQNLGIIIGPTLFGILVETGGWVTAGYALIPFAIIGAITAWLVKVR